MESIVEKLLGSQEPSIRLKIHTDILGEPSFSAANIERQKEVTESGRVRMLLSERKRGIIPFHPYSKWFGSHWVLATLADIRYSPGDRSLIPMREQVYKWLFSKEHTEYFRKHELYAGPYLAIKGLVRAHASMEGNAVYYLNALGVADDRTSELADRLALWQWPDGGWNCDKRSHAHTSSFTESLLPLRGLAFQSKSKGGYRDSIAKAVDFFLERKLFRRKSDGRAISPRFNKLHYPCYWHYDILFGLSVMKEAGYIKDERCSEAISTLESKRLPDGGFPAEERYYQVGSGPTSRRSLVNWGGVNQSRMNEFVTCDALTVLKSARSNSGIRVVTQTGEVGTL